MNGKYTGTFGDYGILSFNGNKIITTSGGGMLLINGENAQERADKVLFRATQAREKAKWYQHEEIGYNYRMSNIVAGIGRGQLKVLNKRIEQKKAIYEYYKKAFQSIEDISLMPMREGASSNCWLSAIVLKAKSKVKAMDLIEALEKHNIESRPIWKPLHLQPVFLGCDFVSTVKDVKEIDEITKADTSVSGEIFEHGVCLPSDTKMTNEDMQRICKAILDLWK